MTDVKTLQRLLRHIKKEPWDDSGMYEMEVRMIRNTIVVRSQSKSYGLHVIAVLPSFPLVFFMLPLYHSLRPSYGPNWRATRRSVGVVQVLIAAISPVLPPLIVLRYDPVLVHWTPCLHPVSYRQVVSLSIRTPDFNAQVEVVPML